MRRIVLDTPLFLSTTYTKQISTFILTDRVNFSLQQVWFGEGKRRKLHYFEKKAGFYLCVSGKRGIFAHIMYNA